MKKARLVFIVAVCVVIIVAVLRLEGRRNQKSASDVGVGTNVVRTATPVWRSGEGSPETEVALEKSSAALSPMRETDSVLVRLEPGHPKPAHIVKAQKDGAQAKITFLVVDDKGRPVPDATVAGGFYNHERDGHGFSSQTQNDGTVELTDLCVWEINYGVEKSGYYETRGRYDFYKAGFDCVKDGRWIPWNPTVEVVLKRKVNPVTMYVRQGAINRLALPKLDDWTGFDLERSDWVQPHGKGKHEDFQVFFRRGETNHMGVFRQFSLTFRFCKPFDGFYLARKDGTGSQFKCIYEADTNRIYETEIEFSYERLIDPVSGRSAYKNKMLEPDEYLVLRIRSETDEEGRLIKANYAKICAPLFAAFYGFQITTYFNPNENDPNLEADTSRNLLNPKDLGFAP